MDFVGKGISIDITLSHFCKSLDKEQDISKKNWNTVNGLNPDRLKSSNKIANQQNTQYVFDYCKT